MSADRLREPGNDMRTTVEPKFDTDSFEDTIQNFAGYDRHVNIEFESYEYDGAVRIVRLKVDLNGIFPSFFEYLQEQILECIGLRINKHNIVLECKLEIV